MVSVFEEFIFLKRLIMDFFPTPTSLDNITR